MAVMNLNRVYYCCLYGNNENEAIIRRIDRDMAYEKELIMLEQDFWENNVLAKLPPPYWEDDGDLILDSLRRTLEPVDKNAPPIPLNKTQSARVTRFLELQEEKGRRDADAKSIEAEMKRLRALIVADMGTRCSAVSEDGCTITWNAVRKSGVSKEGLERLKAVHPDIYTEYVTISESRRFNIRRPKPDAA